MSFGLLLQSSAHTLSGRAWHGHECEDGATNRDVPSSSVNPQAEIKLLTHMIGLLENAARLTDS